MGTSYPSSEQQNSAVHEAGHAVLADYFGIPIAKVELAVEEDVHNNGGCCWVSPGAALVSLQDWFVVLHGGVIARMCVYGDLSAEEADFLSRCEVEELRKWAPMPFSEALIEEQWKKAHRRAVRLLRRRALELLHVAGALLKRGSLTAEETAAAIRSGRKEAKECGCAHRRRVSGKDRPPKC